MSIVVKHVKSLVRPMLRLALGVCLLSLFCVGGAQWFGLDLTSWAATTANELKTLFVQSEAEQRIAPAQTQAGGRRIGYSSKRANTQGHLLKLASTSAAPGSEVIVPVEVNADGSEARLAFSLYFDPVALVQPRVRLAEDTLSAALNLNTEQLVAGRLGIELSLPSGQSLAAGLRKLVYVQFQLARELSVTSLPLNFGDEPVVRGLFDANAVALSTGFINGLITVVPGLEGDVAPRPENGNGSITVADWAQVGRLAVGLDVPSAGSEFQRADCAPRASLGDGEINLADWVQTGRYAAGLDVPVAAGGPSTPLSVLFGTNVLVKTLAEPQQGRRVRVVPATLNRGQDGTVIVELTALGTEFAAGFTLNFDPTQLTFVRAVAGADATNATINANSNNASNGRVTINLQLPFGQKFAAGTRQLLVLTFNVPTTSTLNSTTISFANGAVVDEQANNLPTTFIAGVITLNPQLSNQTPVLTSLTPNTVLVGGNDFMLTVNGANFTNGSTVRINGSDRLTEFVSDSQLRALLLAVDIFESGTLSLTVRTPEGVTTNALTLNINNPVPTLTSLSPPSVSINDPGFTLIVNGTNFVPGAMVRFGNADRLTTFVSSTLLTAVIPGTALNTAGTFNVTVTNPAPGGGTSNALTFTVQARKPIPRLTSLSPNSTQAGGPDFTLTVNGSNFVTESVVRWNGQARQTTFVSATQLTAQITANDIVNAGNASVTVFNSPPGGGVSNAQVFTITQAPVPVPAITALNPASVTAGGANFNLTITGTGFVQASVVRINGQDRPTTFVSATELRAAISAADIANGGTAIIRVFNPASSGGGGGLSNESPLTINFAPPTITLVSPSSAVAGGAAFTLSVLGTNFAPGAVVRWNGENRPTTVVGVTELAAQIPASDIANVGTAKIAVFIPSSNATSNEINFAINQGNRPLPRITALNPDRAVAGGDAFTLTVTGVNFFNDSVVRWNGQPRTTNFVNSTQVTAQITAADIASVGTASVSVFTPAPGGGESNGLNFAITQPPNPEPVIASLNPPNATAGANGLALTINGSGFVQTSVARINGENRPTTFVSANQLTVQLTANDIAAAGTAAITVINPAPGGGTSNAVTLNIINPVPALTSLNPDVVGEDSQGVTLTVNGTGFVRGAQILVNGNARITTFVSATQMTTQLTANDVATIGALQIQVSNPAPGGGLSNTLPLEIRRRNPVPRVTSLNPPSATAGSPGFTLIVNGANFVQGAVVRWNGQDRPTDFGSEILLVAQISASDIAAGGTAQVVVANPAPGGGTSGPVQFAITNPAPRITSISPDSAIGGSGAVDLVVNGSGFTGASIVRFNNNDLSTTFVSNSQLTARIPDTAVATGGTFPIVVFNPPPGGGTSSTVNFTITNPAPTLTQLLPNAAAAGSPSFVLTLVGTGFTPAAVVRWNGQERLTTFGGATRLTALISAADVAQTGTGQVTVFTPAPGGGTSNALSFSVNNEPNPAPTLTALDPERVFTGGAGFMLTVTGTGFVAGSRVLFNGSERLTTYLSATQLAAQISAADIANATTASITVFNPTPGGGSSNALPFNIVPPPSPVPVINTLSPNAAFAGAAGITLTVNGTGFISGSVVRWNGGDRPTTVVSATQLTAQISAADVAAGGISKVTVFNPPSVSGGGGTSNEVNFTVIQLTPTQVTFNPITPSTNDTVRATLSGTWPNGCVPQHPQVSVVGNEVRINTSNPSQACTQAVTPWTLEATFGPLPAPGNYRVRVFYNSPLGQTEIAQTTLTVVNGRPTLVSLTPNQALAGGASRTITVNGTGFVVGAVVLVNGSARLTNFVSPTQLTAQLTESDLLNGGALSITAVNPSPGGGASNALSFTVNNPVPVLSAVNPAAIAVGSGGFNLTVMGAGFVPGAVVRWKGADRPTTFISNTTLTAAIPAADVATAGTATVTAFNPAPGGGLTNGVNVTIDVSPACQSACFQSPAYYLLNMSRLPEGSVVIGGVNFNQPVSVQANLSDIRRALQSGRSALQLLNSEFAAAQLSLLASSGPFGSAGALNGSLRCYGLAFDPVQLGNGFTVTNATTLGDLLAQTRAVIGENREADMSQLARLFDLLNGNDPNSRCSTSVGAGN